MPIVRLAARAMGTRFELVLAGEDQRHLHAVGEAALDEVALCEAQLSRFARDSLIAHVNRTAHRAPVVLDPDTFALLACCARVHRASGGAFDPTVAPLMAALGFWGEAAGSDGLAAARAAVGMDAVSLDGDRGTVRFARPGIELDLGAIGKGHALDLAAEVLREHGVDCALLHGGTSTVVAIGAPPDADGWRVRVSAAAGAPVAVLRDAALSVSAPHGRTAAAGGHVLDPRRGAPASELCCAAVLCASARDADAWSTACLVAPDLPPPAGGVALRARAGAVGDAWQWSGAGELAGNASHFELPSPSTTLPDPQFCG